MKWKTTPTYLDDEGRLVQLVDVARQVDGHVGTVGDNECEAAHDDVLGI